ncbi:MAG: outer membrane beta-barrel protein [Syntrophobacteraceae bacterium]
MKRLIILSLVAVMISVAGFAQAEQNCPLGNGNVAFKVDYLRFTDSDIKDIGAENAIYFGLEAYVPVLCPNFYVGMESGYAFSSGDLRESGSDYDYYAGDYYDYDAKIDFDLDYVPIELNAKYVFEVNPCWNISLGAGISYNYFKIDMAARETRYYDYYYEYDGIYRDSGDVDDWLFGGQFFADVNYTFGQWFVGGNIKYQLTEKLDDAGVSADNLRVGMQLGFMF